MHCSLTVCIFVLALAGPAVGGGRVAAPGPHLFSRAGGDIAPAPPTLPEGPAPLPEADLALRHADALELTEEQLRQLKEARLATRLEAVDLKARQEKARLRLEAALQEEEADLEAARELIHEACEAEAELEYLEVKLMVKTRELLTPEQRDRLERLRPVPPWRVVGPAGRVGPLPRDAGALRRPDEMPQPRRERSQGP